MEDVGIFNGHLVHLHPLGIFCGHLVHICILWQFWYIFLCFGILCQENLATLMSQ
jgi:hypothetical protein